ncbi:MAG TPA: hypothetical protein VHM91_02975, partial [Verrucomicrobiales bacterium]|nr:hypothetical protein [Verrucomicrobiales bacterium]
MRPFSSVWITCAAIAGGFVAARFIHSFWESPPNRLPVIPKSGGPGGGGVPEAAKEWALKEKGSRQVPEMIAAVENAGVADLRKL